MHLKNFSLISRNKITQLSPVYDLLNTSIALENVMEEMALPLNGKKHRLQLDDFTTYYAKTILSLNDKVINQILNNFVKHIKTWPEFIKCSKLSAPMQTKYIDLLTARAKNLRIIR